jgi:hypothetical protein
MKYLYKKYIILFLTLVLIYAEMLGQVLINFTPAVNGQSLDGIAYALLNNQSTNELNLKLTVKVRNLTSGQVVTIRVPEFTIGRGVNPINRLAFSRATIIFGNNKEAEVLRQTQRFPEGEYEYCFQADATIAKSTTPAGYFENCFIHLLQPTTPLLLINPIDGDKLCQKRPVFNWQPPMPIIPGLRYRMILVQVHSDQTAAEAVIANIPVINQMNLTANMLLYPVHSPELGEGKKYAWQVIAYSMQTVLTKSEIWTFTVECDKEKEVADGDSYREVNAGNDGSFYVANKYLRFSFTNPYNTGVLNYSIKSFSEPDKTVKRLPVLKMQTGLNKYVLDFTNNRFFKDGEQYQLEIMSGDGKLYTLRFVYYE